MGVDQDADFANAAAVPDEDFVNAVAVPDEDLGHVEVVLDEMEVPPDAMLESAAAERE